MKLLYTSGQFLFNEKWPETPKKVECVSDTACLCAKYAMRDGANRDVVDYYDENCPHRYQSALSQAFIAQSFSQKVLVRMGLLMIFSKKVLSTNYRKDGR
jgi:hypothetical protein